MSKKVPETLHFWNFLSLFLYKPSTVLTQILQLSFYENIDDRDNPHHIPVMPKQIPPAIKAMFCITR